MSVTSGHSAAQVAEAIRAYQYAFVHEGGLQEGVAAALYVAGLPAQREVRLSAADRVDILVEGVAVEVKIAGTTERALGQLQRYATHDQITGLVLVTTRARHRALPSDVGGKPLTVVHLGGAG